MISFLRRPLNYLIGAHFLNIPLDALLIVIAKVYQLDDFQNRRWPNPEMNQKLISYFTLILNPLN